MVSPCRLYQLHYITLINIAHHFVRMIHVSESESAHFLLRILLISLWEHFYVLIRTSPDSEHIVHRLWSRVPGDTRRVHRGIGSSCSWTSDNTTDPCTTWHIRCSTWMIWFGSDHSKHTTFLRLAHHETSWMMAGYLTISHGWSCGKSKCGRSVPEHVPGAAFLNLLELLVICKKKAIQPTIFSIVSPLLLLEPLEP